MAVLSDGDRKAVWADLMSYWSSVRDGVAVSKADLRAAVDAIDQYLHDNAAAINSAIPQPARANLTTAQKAILLNYVVAKRYIKGA
jgi:hypothetical protein